MSQVDTYADLTRATLPTAAFITPSPAARTSTAMTFDPFLIPLIRLRTSPGQIFRKTFFRQSPYITNQQTATKLSE